MSSKEHSPSSTKNYPLSKEEHAKLLDRIHNEYPKEIDLIQFAQQRKYGYTIDVRGSTKNAVVLQQHNKEGVAIDTIIVRRNEGTGQYYYTNPNDSRDKGPIYKFVMHRMQTTSYMAVDKELSEYLSIGNLKEVEPQIKRVAIGNSPTSSRSAEIAKHYNLTPLTDMSYLKSRGISENVLNSYEFSGRVLNEIAGRDKQFVNTAFPMYNREGEIVGIERKNYTYNGGSFGGAAEGSDKANSVWFSKIRQETRVDKIVLGETPIDLISYHQLRDKAKIENNLYVSSNGYWSNNQKDMVQELINKHQPKGIILANDNDNSGKRFNISLLGQLHRPVDPKEIEKSPLNNFEPKPLITKDNKLTVECDLEGKFTARLRFNAVFDKQSDGIKVFQEIEKRVEQIRDLSSQPVTSKIAEISDNKGVYEVRFVNSTLELNKAMELVKDLRGMNNYISIEKARGKDFNEDLQVAVGLIKDPNLANTGQSAKLTPEELKRQQSFDMSNDLNERKTGFGR